ncbi:MAG: C40 family peptidase [Arcobacteraceae bacterium]|jgi:cell wall-associated NlpC family hydrolase|nr:C40 family peptidase [Arcobacteraceae bacterium]MDY0365826.1 C40 family peptidase [Arcobacteraceae bacterium]
MINKFLIILLLSSGVLFGDVVENINAEPSIFDAILQVEEKESKSKLLEDVKKFVDNTYNEVQNKILDFAHSFLGQKYQFGASKNSSRVDCSLYTQNVYSKAGIKIPRTSIEQSKLGVKVSKDELQAGDLLFFNTNKKAISHVGIYIGDNKMIHASYGVKKVIIEDINKKYFKDRFVVAKRVL